MRILIVDDEKHVINAIRLLIPTKMLGISEILTAQSCAAAKVILDREKPEIAIVDIIMQKETGISLMTYAACNHLKTRFIVVSGHSDYEYVRTTLLGGAVDYLLKPVSFAALMECFESIRTQLDQETQQSEELPRSFWQETIQEVLTYINEHSRDASLERAAERVHLSPSYLSRNFKEKSGESFSHALIRIRMEKAKDMLMDARNRSYDIAYFVGYDNPKNFSRAFKSYYGMSPSEYRKSVLGGEESE